MITEFKIFEELNEDKPKVGDYVMVDSKYYQDIEYQFTFQMNDVSNLTNFLNNSIGYIFKNPNKSSFYLIKYDNIPKDIERFFYYTDYSEGMKIGNSLFVSINKIKYWSKNKKDLQHFIDANKFNM